MGKNTGSKIAIGALISMGVGYAAGILTAQKSGKETRADITRAAHEAKSQAEKNIKALHKSLNDLVGQAEEILENTKESAKVGLKNAVESAKLAKEHAVQVLSAIREGDAEDEDLKDAVEQANQAVDHLKKYLNKEKPAAK